MRNFKYSWQQIAKASFVGIATTATFYLAKTAGLFSSWLSTEDSTDVIPRLDRGIHERGTELSAMSMDPAIKSRDDGHEGEQLKTGQRRLLQSSGVTVTNPIPDQVIQVNQQYTYSLDNVFSGNYSLLGAVETGKNSLPSWLSAQPNFLSSFSASTYDIAISGNTAFVVAGGVLTIIDVSNISNPRLLSSHSPGFGATMGGIAINGNTAFIAAFDFGLRIMDVSNTSNPRLLSTFPSGSGYAVAVTLNGNTAFVSIQPGVLQIINVSNVSNPTLLSTYNSSNSPAGVVINGSIAFVANFGLQILNVSNTSNPTLISNFFPSGSSGSASGIAMSGNTVFLAFSTGGLKIIDVTNLTNPRLLSSFSMGTGTTALGVTVSGNMVFLAYYTIGLQILDVSSTSNPRLLLSYPPGTGRTYAVRMNGSIAFVANTKLEIIDISQVSLVGVPPASSAGQQISITTIARTLNSELASDSFLMAIDQFPQPVTSTVSDQSVYPFQSFTLLLSSKLLFTNPGNSFLKLSVKLTNGNSAPSWLKLTVAPVLLFPPSIQDFGAYGVVAKGNTVFVASGYLYSGLQIFNIDQLSSPRRLSFLGTGSVGYGVAIRNNTAFVVDASTGLNIIDVSNTSNSILCSIFPTQNGTAQGISISENNLALIGAGNGGLRIVDVTDRNNPRLLSTLSGIANRVTVSGNTAFATSGNLRIFNISNASNPYLLSSYSRVGSSIAGVAISGNTAFVTGVPLLQIIDIKNITNPRFVANYSVSGSSSQGGLAIKGSTVFVAATTGLQIVDVSNLSSPEFLGSYPNGVAFSGLTYDIAVSGNTAFVADYYFGLMILDLSQWQLTATPGPGDVGNYQLQIIATDELGGSASTQPFTIRVEGPPRFNSTIPTQYAKVGQAFNYFIPQGLVNDPNNDPISFSARLANNQSLPTWLSFSSISAAFVGTPQSNNVGNLTIVLSATDNIAGSANTSFILMTNNLPMVNQRLSNTFARVNQFFQLIIPNNTFSHPDNLAMNYSAQLGNQAPLPSWLRFNASSLLLSGQPNATDAGNYDLRIVVTDIYAGQASTSFTLSVGNGVQVNRLINSQLAGVGLRYVFVVPSDSFVNPDGTPFNLQSSALPSWLTFAATTAQFSGTPLASSRGITLINLTATDTTGGTAMQSFNLTVTYFPQVVNPTADQIAPIGYPYQLAVSSSAFIDQNGYALTYRAEQSNGQSLPNWLNFNATSLQFSGLPNMTQALRYSLAVIASNPLGAEARDEFSLYAEHYPTVQQPIPDTVAGVDIPLRLTISGSSFLDLDNDVLRYNVTRADRSPLPTWLTFDSQLLVLSGTPLAAQLGNWSFLVTATDPSSGSAAQNFTLIVRYLPVVSQPIGDITPVREGRLLNYTLPAGTFTEAGGASLSYNATQISGAALPSWLVFTSQTQNFIGVPSVTDVGSLSVRVIADDGQGGQASVSFSFTITPNYPPVLAKPISNSVASVNQPFRLALPPDTFSDANNDPLSYTASQVDGSTLPRWLAFDEKTITFSGTPGRSDTGDFSERIIPVRVTARDDQNSARTQFNINVQGTSNIALFVQIATPIATIFTALFAAYKKRALCFNRYKKERYERLDMEVKVGEVFEHKFGDMNLFGKKILVKTPRQLQGWGKLFTSPRERVPGGGDMPSWMEYDIDSNSLRSTIPVPEDSPRELIVQVKDDASIVHEQFTLRVVGLKAVLNPQPQSDMELAATSAV